MYKLEYLPIARQDMIDIAQYISKKLNNPAAAYRIAAKLIEAGERISRFPYANPAYMPIRPLTHEYRKLMVENYIMLYWIDEGQKLITIARVIYARRNYGSLLE